MIVGRGIVAVLLRVTSRGFSADHSPDTTAKFLAGLVVPAGPVGVESGQNPWTTHSVELDRAWKHTEQQQLSAIASWAP